MAITNLEADNIISALYSFKLDTTTRTSMLLPHNNFFYLNANLLFAILFYNHWLLSRVIGLLA
jgi:hypothetical protein